MQVFVRSLTGKDSLINTKLENNIQSIKDSIHDSEGIDASLMNLIFEGSTLDNEKTLEEAGVKSLSTLHLVLSLEGGKKKKKRKNYTTKKKNKHRHTSVKLHTLKFYSLKDDKVVRLRKVCTKSPRCGPGTFMAKHVNRFYCGKCHFTYKLDDKKEE